MQKFIPGQRWISDAETELGLGTILKVEHRTVTVVYLASGELRTYATENAPLTRVWFDSGDRIKGHDGRDLMVNSYTETDGILSYTGVHEDGTEGTLDETELDNFIQFNRPSDKLLNAQFERERVYYLRLATREMQSQLVHSDTYGLGGARAELIAHQLYIAHEVSTRLAPRVLLADEVGLGKTIEAGLIMHRQLAIGQIQRILVIVPEPLTHQWLVEMRRRFNLSFGLMNHDLYDTESATDGNPFVDHQLILTTLPFLLADTKVAENAIEAGWDMIVVDEAHHLQAGNDADHSPEYQCVARLAASVPSLLLLTATPEQLGHDGHFARLQLLDPDRFPSLQQFREEEQQYRKLASIADNLLSAQPLDAAQQQMLQTLDIATDADDPRATVDHLIDHHGTGRVMFRNTRQAVSGFPKRHFAAAAIDDGTAALAAWLATRIQTLAPAKLLLIARSVERVEQLSEQLRVAHGVHAAEFHEQMSIVERDRAAEFFADEETGSSIMLCSEIGSEGRNFQFLQHLVLVDLPDNADLLEQRIGRLDRIGQADEIFIHLPYVSSSADDFLRRWYHEGLNAFEQTCQVGSAVQQALRERFDAAMKGDLTDLDALIAEASSLASAQREQIEQGRDRLLELSSHREAVSDELIASIDSYDTDPALQRFMERVFDNLGLDLEDQAAHTWIVRPGDHMAVSDFPGLPEDGCTITYRRHIALAREDVQFLSWEHPLVRTAMDQVISGGFGQVTIGAMQSDLLKRGSVLLEAHYVFDCPAPPSLGVERYLNGELLRVVLDESGNDQADALPRDELDEAFRSIKPQLAKQLVKVKRAELAAMLEQAEKSATQSLEVAREQAIAEAREQLGAELTRLEALARRNPSVRADEIERLRERLEQTCAALGRLRCVLDLVRVFGIA